MVGVIIELLTRVWVCYLSVPSSAPLLVSTRNLSSSSIAVVWQRPLEANGEITEYTLTLFGPGGSNTTHTPNTSFVLTNLLPYTAYNLTITAATRKGSGPYLMLQLHTDEGGEIDSFFENHNEMVSFKKSLVYIYCLHLPNYVFQAPCLLLVT